MTVVTLKAGVETCGLAPAGLKILAKLDMLAEILKRDLVVTSVSDGNRRADDPHKRGNAVDLRVLDWPEATILTAVRWLRMTLGPDFTVLYEVPTAPHGILATVATVNPHATAPHCHIQLKKGLTTYPPADRT